MGLQRPFSRILLATPLPVYRYSSTSSTSNKTCESVERSIELKMKLNHILYRRTVGKQYGNSKWRKHIALPSDQLGACNAELIQLGRLASTDEMHTFNSKLRTKQQQKEKQN